MWWNENWLYRRVVRILTPSESIPAHHPVLFPLNLAVTRDLGKLRDDYADLRVIANDEDIVAAQVMEVSDILLNVYFDAKEAIGPSLLDYTYHVYYGNPYPPPLQIEGDYNSGIYDDFLVYYDDLATTYNSLTVGYDAEPIPLSELPSYNDAEYNGDIGYDDFLYYVAAILAPLPHYNDVLGYDDYLPYDVIYALLRQPVYVPYSSPRFALTRPESWWDAGVTSIRWSQATIELAAERLSLLAQVGPDQAIAEVQVDDGPWQTVDLFSLTERTISVFEVDNLSFGLHRFRFRHSGRKNPSSIGDKVNFVAVEYRKPMIVLDLGEETLTTLKWAASTGGQASG